MSDQPEALRLAQKLENRALMGVGDWFAAELDAARLLREQHAEIKRLKELVIDAILVTVERDAAEAALREQHEEVERLWDVLGPHLERQHAEIERLQEAVKAIRARGEP